MKHILYFLFLPLLLIAQGLDVTGRISVRTTQTQYNETSQIKPDSIADEDYSKASLIPGLQENFNLAIFARTSRLDMTLLGDLSNNVWNRFDIKDLKTVNRLSFTTRFDRHEIVLGDFFESGSEMFIQSREVRGGKVHLYFENLWNAKAFIESHSVAGIVQKSFQQDSRLIGLYKQYETSGLYRRNFAYSRLTGGETGRYQLSLNYLYGRDDSTSISSSYNPPVSNRASGGEAQVSLFSNRLKLFGEGYISNKDTLNAGSARDNSYKTGLDFRLSRIWLNTTYQRIGFDYFTAGYPYLLNDRQGFFLSGGYLWPGRLLFNLDLEQYHNNLNDDSNTLTTQTLSGIFSVTTQFSGWPEMHLKYIRRGDRSDELTDADDKDIQTKKVSNSGEVRLAHNIGSNRFSVSGLYISQDDNSVLSAGNPLSSSQMVGTVNMYFRPASVLNISGGAVYSTLKLTESNSDDKPETNTNLYLYESSRWDIVPQKLTFESTISVILNNAGNGGTKDLLNDYQQIIADLSLEFFFTSYFSVKALAGTNQRQFAYSPETAKEIIANPDYGPLYFNSNESYNGLIYGLEVNLIF